MSRARVVPTPRPNARVRRRAFLARRRLRRFLAKRGCVVSDRAILGLCGAWA